MIQQPIAEMSQMNRRLIELEDLDRWRDKDCELPFIVVRISRSRLTARVHITRAAPLDLPASAAISSQDCR